MKKKRIEGMLTRVGLITMCFLRGKFEALALQRHDLNGLSAEKTLSQVVILLLVVILVLAVNMIQRQKTAQLLRQSEENYKELLMGMPNAVIWIEKREVKFINQGGIEFFGAESGKEISFSRLKETVVVNFERLEKDELPKQVEIKVKTFKNEIKDAEVTVVVKNKNKPDSGVIVLIEDISHRKLLYESTEREKIKNEFFSNLSHEFKTPINLISSTVKLLEQIKDSQEDMQRLLPNGIRVLSQNAYRLNRLINNIMDATVIDSGDIKLDLHNCNIVELTEDITLSAVKYAEDNDIEILFDTEIEELETAVDIDKYERIILNLISNAIKYNRKDGQILVSLNVQDNEAVVSVKDTGIGINQELLPYIFEPFMQVNKSFVRNAEGSGIGLALVKALVKIHKGKIEVKSQEGQGSEFIVHLPIYTVEDEEDSVIRSLLYKHKERNTKIELSDIYVKQY